MKRKSVKQNKLTKQTKFQTLNSINKDVIKSTAGSTFTVTFIKSDGTERTMLAKVGVKKFLSKRVGKRTVKDNPNLVRVFDMESKSYKSFKLDTVKEFKCKYTKFVGV